MRLMKKTLILSILIALFLFTVSPVSANNGKDDNDRHNSFSESFNRFFKDRRDDFNRFRHRDDHKKHDDNDHDDDDDEHEHGCDDDKHRDDDECVVSAPEFGSVTGPITFLVSTGAMVIAKKRLII